MNNYRREYFAPFVNKDTNKPFTDLEYVLACGEYCKKLDSENESYGRVPTNYGDIDIDMAKFSKDIYDMKYGLGEFEGKPYTDMELNKIIQNSVKFN